MNKRVSQTHKSFAITLFLWLSFLGAASIKAQTEQPETLLKQAIQALDQEQQEVGLALLQKVLRLKPDYYDARYTRAYYWMMQEVYELAIADFDTLIQFYPQDPNLYIYRAEALRWHQQTDQAEQNLQMALTLKPQWPEALQQLGEMRIEQANYDEALNLFDQALQADPAHLPSLYYKAYTQYLQEDYEKALQTLQTYFLKDNKDKTAYSLKAKIYLAQTQYVQAIQTFERMEQLGFTFDLDDFYYWAQAYYKQQNYPQALLYLQTPDPIETTDDSDYSYLMGKTYYGLKDYAQAEEYFLQAVAWGDSTDEAYAPVFYNQAVALFRVKRPQEAVKAYLQALYLMPELANKADSLRQSLDLLDNLSTLLKPYLKTAQIDSASCAGWLARAETLLLQEDHEAAYALITPLEKRCPSARLFYLMAGCEALQENSEQALALYQKALLLKPEPDLAASIYYQQAVTHYYADEMEKALVCINNALKINPQEATYWYEKSVYFAYLPQPDSALSAIEQAIRLQPQDESFWIQKSNCLIELEKYSQATEAANQVIVLQPGGLQGYRQRGMANFYAQNYAAATADFETALRQSPTEAQMTELKEWLAECQSHIK